MKKKLRYKEKITTCYNKKHIIKGYFNKNDFLEYGVHMLMFKDIRLITYTKNGAIFLLQRFDLKNKIYKKMDFIKGFKKKYINNEYLGTLNFRTKPLSHI